MKQFSRIAALVAAVLTVPYVRAQYPPAAEYSNIINSPIDPNITIAYKTPPAGTCTTAFSTQQQYTGYIGLPPFTLAPVQQNYSINTFFWFIEARQNPESAPLTIWLNGGPGSSSMVGLFEESGPCEVVQMADGSYGTRARMWGWDRSSNILFIDQPAQVGFSYDSLTNASYDLLDDSFSDPTGVPSGQPAYTYLNGTFGSGDQSSTANTTDIAARAAWHFLQGFLSAFPQYNPGLDSNSSTSNANASTTGVNLFAESYGGIYGPTFANFFEEQNARRENGSLSKNNTLAIQLTSLGILNGCVDTLIQTYYDPLFAYNNTYGIDAISQTEELNAIQLYTSSCQQAIRSCRDAVNTTDPEGDGDVAATNQACETALYACNSVGQSYYANGYSAYDIRVKTPSPDPPASYQEYLNQASVQSAIGARVNYTQSNSVVTEAFTSTGDMVRGGTIDDLASLLRLGVRVALIYGDADFICNWKGGEAVSFAVAAAVPDYPSNDSTSYASKWNEAGYAQIVVNTSYVGGVVRQYGDLSFSRIYDAGHMVPYYQPETAFTVFARIVEGTDISTGEPVNATFGSTGPMNATHTNSAPKQPSPTCWIRAINDTCSSSQAAAIAAGEGVVEAGVWYSDSKDYSAPSSTVAAGVPGTPVSQATSSSGSGSASSSTSVALTGVFTATATPSPSSAADRTHVSSIWILVMGVLGLGTVHLV